VSTRGSKAQKAKRVHKIYQLILAGMDRESIILAGERLGWSVSVRTIDSYIAAATERLERASKPKEAEDLGKAKARLDALYGLAWQNGDVRGALAVVDKTCDLLGLKNKGDLGLAAVDEFLHSWCGDGS